jgi:hypothetical protein
MENSCESLWVVGVDGFAKWFVELIGVVILVMYDNLA